MELKDLLAIDLTIHVYLLYDLRSNLYIYCHRATILDVYLLRLSSAKN